MRKPKKYERYKMNTKKIYMFDESEQCNRSINCPTSTNLLVEDNLHLYTIFQVDQLQLDLVFMTEISAWIRGYLAKPHPDLGRDGTVCPFVPRAIETNSIYLSVCRTKNLDEEKIKKIVIKHRDVFLALGWLNSERTNYNAILIIFPDIIPQNNSSLIDGIQKLLKSDFVEMGLMIGEFHELNLNPGLHNQNFYPLRSPIPILAIRKMVTSDLVFLIRDIDPPNVRIKFLDAYLNHLTLELSDMQNRIANEALKKAKEEQSRMEYTGNLKYLIKY